MIPDHPEASALEPAEDNEATPKAEGPDATRAAQDVPYFLQITLLVLLTCTAAFLESGRLSSLLAADAWMHLRAGLWILQNHAVPRAGLFSQSPELTWTDLHWLYEAALALAYKAVGLRAIPLAAMGVKTILAVCVFRLARCRRAAFVPSLILSGFALAIMDRGSVLELTSAVFLALELCVVARFREHGNLRQMWPLVPLFAVWANVDSGFVYGVALLVLFAAAVAVQIGWQQTRGEETISWLPAGKALVLAAVGGASTLISPYFSATWTEAWAELYSDTAIKHFAEMRPMAFRVPMDFIAMLFVMGSLTVLGFRRRRDLFQLSAIALAMAVAFRFQREFWLVALCCVAAVAEALAPRAQDSERLQTNLSHKLKMATAAIVVTVFVLSGARVPHGQRELVRKSGAILPIAACDAIRSAQLPQPLFHSYAWSGFLVWYLPEYPVVIDNRLGLYGEERNKRFFDLMEGKARLEETPEFSRANTLLLEKDSALAKALVNLPRLSAQFRVAYQDDVAIVFVRN